MKLRNLLHIQKDNIYIIGSLTPPFFFRASDTMIEFIQLCGKYSVEASLNLLKEKYSFSEFDSFQQRLNKVRDKLFVNDNQNIENTIDLLSKVYILTLNVTRKCNLKCDYCFEDSEYRKLGNMSFNTAKKAIDTFFTSETNSPNWVIIFTGGEPLLNFSLLNDVVEYINNKNLKVEYRIKTNATLLNESQINYLIKNNFKIQISLDGNKIAHDTHRKFSNGKGSFEIVDQTIQNLIKRNYGSKISISGTLTHQTSQYVDDCYSHLNSYKGINRYSLKCVMPNSSTQCVFNLEDYKTTYISTIKNNAHLMQQASNLMENNYNVCGIGVWNITIDVDETIYPCYRMCGNDKYSIGTLDSFTLPFKLPYQLENIYRLENNAQCAKCYMVNICKMGCYTDKLMTPNGSYNCFKLSKKITEEMLYNEFFNKKMYLFLDTV